MKWLMKLGVGTIYAFLFLPMFVLVILSFNSAPRGAHWEGFTLSWYSKLFENAAILEALNRSLEIAVQATILSGVIGLCVGMTLGRGRGPRPAATAMPSTDC